MQLPIRSLLLSPSGRVAQGAERGQFKFRPFFQALSLLIFLAKKSAKIVSRYAPSPCLHKIFSHYAASPWGEALPQSGGDEGQFHRRKSKNIQTNGLKKTAHFNQTIHKKICFR